MLSLLVVLLMEREDLLDLRALELLAERRRLAPSPLPVVQTPHRIRPSIAISHTETDLVLREHCFERLTINRSRIEEGLHHLVAEHLLKATLCEPTATQIPVGLWLLGVGEHLTPFVPHQLVVHLP